MYCVLVLPPLELEIHVKDLLKHNKEIKKVLWCCAWLGSATHSQKITLLGMVIFFDIVW